MSKRNRNTKKDETLVDLVEVTESAQDFFERNSRILSIIAGALLLIVGGFFAYRYLIQMPKEKEAMEQMHMAEYQFSVDSFSLALLNPGGGFEGFLDIIENYGGTKAANISNYYAGICYLNIGSHAAALDYLKDFKPDGRITPIMKFGAMGDAYSELGQFDNAISQYKKAISEGDNELLTSYYMKKLGMLYEHQGDVSGALAQYKAIKSQYPLSVEGRDIDKHIARLN